MKYSFCLYPLKEIMENWYNFFINSWCNSPVNPSGPGAFCFGLLITTDSICLIDLGLFRYLLLIMWVLSDCVFQRIGPFPVGFLICRHSIPLLSF